MLILFSQQKSKHETKLYNMFSKNNIPKNVHQIGSRKSSLQDREHKVPFPPSKKPRPAENCMSRQAGVEDDIWGDELDANSVEECFLLATQAMSQVCITNKVWQLPSFSPQFNDSIAAFLSTHIFMSLFFFYICFYPYKLRGGGFMQITFLGAVCRNCHTLILYTGLFKMIVRVLTTCHTQYT